MPRMKLVMIGNGMAGVRALEELLKIAPALYDITVFGAEPHPNYNRIMLSPVLAGEQTLEEIVLNPMAWYAQHAITLHAGTRVTRIDRARCTVEATRADGQTITATYDRLILATGSNPFILPVPGHDLQGVIAYRDIADTQAMIETARTHRHAVVIGGGLLGLEAANGLKLRGMEVTVIHIGPWLLERQLDETAGRLLQKALEDRGLSFALGAHTDALIGDADDGCSGRVRALRLKDGREIPADLVVMAAGIRPNTAVAREAGLVCDHDGRGGIRVTDTMQTASDARIWAVGECASHRGIAYGLVAPLYEQARVLAAHLAEAGTDLYTGSQISTKLKVTGIDLFSAGDFMGDHDSEEILLSDPAEGVYRKLVLRGGRLVGACLYGDTGDGSWYFDLIRSGEPVGAMREQLMFGKLPAERPQTAPALA
ncbi:MAG: nitrite reductase large subunit [Pseudomonadota bacterium]|nr:nitrite reductase large subunit [Pseudomonadota bacterium]